MHAAASGIGLSPATQSCRGGVFRYTQGSHAKYSRLHRLTHPRVPGTEAGPLLLFALTSSHAFPDRGTQLESNPHSRSKSHRHARTSHAHSPKCTHAAAATRSGPATTRAHPQPARPNARTSQYGPYMRWRHRAANAQHPRPPAAPMPIHSLIAHRWATRSQTHTQKQSDSRHAGHRAAHRTHSRGLAFHPDNRPTTHACTRTQPSQPESLPRTHTRTLGLAADQSQTHVGGTNPNASLAPANSTSQHSRCRATDRCRAPARTHPAFHSQDTAPSRAHSPKPGAARGNRGHPALPDNTHAQPALRHARSSCRAAPARNP